MSKQPQQADHSRWRQLFNLGEQLMAQPTIAAQRELIVETAVRLVRGRADLWLSEALRWLPRWCPSTHGVTVRVEKVVDATIGCTRTAGTVYVGRVPYLALPAHVDKEP